MSRAIYGRDPDGNAIELIEFVLGMEHVYHSEHLALVAPLVD